MLVNSFNITSRMSKKFKYVLGNKICEESLALSRAVATAYQENEDMAKKAALLKLVLRKVTSVLILYRAAMRLNTVAYDSCCEQIDLCVSIIRQATGWLNKVAGNKSEHDAA